MASVQKLFAGLQKFRLSSPELLMIANIRPEGYDQITPLIIDIRNRFDDDQVYVRCNFKTLGYVTNAGLSLTKFDSSLVLFRDAGNTGSGQNNTGAAPAARRRPDGAHASERSPRDGG